MPCKYPRAQRFQVSEGTSNHFMQVLKTKKKEKNILLVQEGKIKTQCWTGSARKSLRQKPAANLSGGCAAKKVKEAGLGRAPTLFLHDSPWPIPSEIS